MVPQTRLSGKFPSTLKHLPEGESRLIYFLLPSKVATLLIGDLLVINMAQPSGKGTAGVLQIPAAATQKSTPAAKKAPKPPAPRLKLIIRRLPPGLTQAELEESLGSEWKVGGGKVDWVQYKPGKVSKEYELVLIDARQNID